MIKKGGEVGRGGEVEWDGWGAGHRMECILQGGWLLGMGWGKGHIVVCTLHGGWLVGDRFKVLSRGISSKNRVLTQGGHYD